MAKNFLHLLPALPTISFATTEGLGEGAFSPVEMAFIRQVADLRQREAERMGKRDAYGFSGRDGPLLHLLGALGEAATARVLHVPWDATVNTFKLPDLSDFLQVKTRSRRDYELLVRPDAKNDETYLHVTAGLETDAPKLVLHGFMAAGAAKRPEWRQCYGGRPPAYFVPNECLVPLAEVW